MLLNMYNFVRVVNNRKKRNGVMHMKKELKIKNVEAIEILDSRGNPTVETIVSLDGGVEASAKVPSGASTGSFEAVELRDGEDRFSGKGVRNAVENVNKKIYMTLEGQNVYNQQLIDDLMIKLDGTENKSQIGANAMIATSMAVARVAARSLGLPLYNYLGGISSKTIPIPMMNILNGGKHASNSVNIQEFMIVPSQESSFIDVLDKSKKVYDSLKKLLNSKGFSVGVGDEGGFAPDLPKDEDAIKFILEAIEKAGFSAGKDFSIALDIASTEMFEKAKEIGKEGYYFWKTNEYKSKEEMIDFIVDLYQRYPIISIEDGLAEEDWESWRILTKELGEKVLLVGDDLFVTNQKRLKKGIVNNIANSILIKPNQIGTVTETLNTIKIANENGYKTVISHRSGETEDTFIADLAVATNSPYIKTGAPCRTDRIAKYNRLLNIENEFNC